MKQSLLDVMQPGPYLVFFDESDAMALGDVRAYMEDRTRTAILGPVESVWGSADGTLHATFRNRELQRILSGSVGTGASGELVFPSDGECLSVGGKRFKNWMFVYSFRGMSIAHLNTVG